MLAQNFKSAADLDITEAQKDALIKTLVLLETGKLEFTKSPGFSFLVDIDAKFTGHFNMAHWRRKTDCGTIGCIGGTAELVGDVTFDDYHENEGLLSLFNPRDVSSWRNLTTEAAARALRSYLTTGDARWDLAVA